jgi:ornithine cyclodeaminase
MRILDQHDVMDLLPVERCIEAVEQAMVLSARGLMEQPLRSVFPAGEGRFGVMPGAARDGVFGAKLVSVFERGAAGDFQSHQGVVVIFDPASGFPTALIDAGAITAVRTAAATALATRVLARPDARVLAVIGAGAQAPLHIQALCAVRAFDEVRIWSRSTAAASVLAERMALPAGQARACPSLDEALSGADVVCTLTASRTPLFGASAIAPGTHVNLVGSSTADAREVESDLVQAGRLFVDLRAGVIAQGGEFRAARAEGLVDDDHILGEIGDVIDGRVAGRQHPSDMTLYKSLGLVAQDLFAAQAVLAAAERADRGVVVDFRSRRF